MMEVSRTELHNGLMDGTIPYRTYYETQEKAEESSKAALFLQHANKKKCKPLMTTDLHNQYSTGSDKYPLMVDKAYN
jgi:hypothetical protein